ncbi:Helix-turn-helix domain-containing protein [Hyphomicrobium sp. 1Nfss2.1]|uniref:helix-turn-helix domain-containing protein n=1 Tax=Hyphomicrobium sp. 1Nfss2.1 TaxID=3413936 RepID=UPI003C7CAE3F
MTEVKPLLIPIADAARMLNCCRETLYHMEKRGELRMVRPFKRTMVPVSEIERIVRGEPLSGEVGEPVGEPAPREIKKLKLFPMVTQ